MEDILLLIVITYSVSLGFGFLLQKHLRMPWMFASLFFGLILSTPGLFTSTIESDLFKMLETFGMYFLLFIIGFSLDFRKMARLRNYVVSGTIIIVGCEGFLEACFFILSFQLE